jgi:hypothetical protein
VWSPADPRVAPLQRVYGKIGDDLSREFPRRHDSIISKSVSPIEEQERVATWQASCGKSSRPDARCLSRKYSRLLPKAITNARRSIRAALATRCHPFTPRNDETMSALKFPDRHRATAHAVKNQLILPALRPSACPHGHACSQYGRSDRHSFCLASGEG